MGVLWSSGLSSTLVASGLFLEPPLQLPGGPPGEQGVTTSPPAMASSNVSRTGPTWGPLEGDRAAVPAGREDSQQPHQGSRPLHSQRRCKALLSRTRPLPPASGRCCLRPPLASPPQKSPRSLPGAGQDPV